MDLDVLVQVDPSFTEGNNESYEQGKWHDINSNVISAYATEVRLPCSLTFWDE